MAHPAHNALQPGLGNQPVKFFHVTGAALLVARQHKHGIADAERCHQPRRFHQHFLALPVGQPPRQQHDALVRFQPPLLAQFAHPRRIDRGG